MRIHYAKILAVILTLDINMASHTFAEDAQLKGCHTEKVLLIFCTKHLYNLANNSGTSRKLHDIVTLQEGSESIFNSIQA
jgi:hypothetical protein